MGHYQVQIRPETIENGYVGGDHHQVQHRTAKGLGAGGCDQQPFYLTLNSLEGMLVLAIIIDHVSHALGILEDLKALSMVDPTDDEFGGSQAYYPRPGYGSPSSDCSSRSVTLRWFIRYAMIQYHTITSEYILKNDSN